jgi:hypothetical protein
MLAHIQRDIKDVNSKGQQDVCKLGGVPEVFKSWDEDFDVRFHSTTARLSQREAERAATQANILKSTLCIDL